MTYQDLVKRVDKEIVILDGSTGVMMQQRGMPAGVCPEAWYLKKPDDVVDILSQYVEAGSSVVYTFTLGANPVKLREYGHEKDAYEINRELARLAKRAADGRALVAFGPIKIGQSNADSNDQQYQPHPTFHSAPP